MRKRNSQLMKVSHKKFAREFIIIMLSQISRSSKIILFDLFIASLDIAKISHASKNKDDFTLGRISALC